MVPCASPSATVNPEFGSPPVGDVTAEACTVGPVTDTISVDSTLLSAESITSTDFNPMAALALTSDAYDEAARDPLISYSLA